MPYDQFYYAPVKEARCRFTVLGSRFIVTLKPSPSEKSAQKSISAVSSEFPDATHHTFAYRIGCGSAMIERASDDREPAGTAGLPMLQVLQGSNVSAVIIIATRYFGGTKLGIGGLTRAYRDCARMGLEETQLEKKEPLEYIRLQLSYEDQGAVSRLIESLSGTIAEVAYSDKVTINLSIPSRGAEALITGFQSACRGRGTWENLKQNP